MLVSVSVAFFAICALSNAHLNKYDTAKYTHNPKKCSACDNENDWKSVWEDIVFITDTTDEVGENNVKAMQSLLNLIATSYQISQSDGKYTRVGIVNVGNEVQVLANLTKYNCQAEMRADLAANFHALGGYLFHPDLALEAAKTIFEAEENNHQRQYVRKVVVMFSSRQIICSDTSKKRKLDGDDNACRIASQMKSNGILIITVALAVAQYDPPPIDISPPCFRLTNNQSLVPDIMKILCKANCFCVPPLSQQYTDEQNCEFYSECIYAVDAQLNYTAAQAYCKNLGSTLSDILAPKKDEFLDEAHLDGGCWPFWVGQRLNTAKNSYIWDSNQESANNDYSKWKSGEPNPSMYGDCVVKGQEKFETYWKSEPCTKKHYFSCQKSACDVNNYCDYKSLI